MNTLKESLPYAASVGIATIFAVFINLIKKKKPTTDNPDVVRVKRLRLNLIGWNPPFQQYARSKERILCPGCKNPKV